VPLPLVGAVTQVLQEKLEVLTQVLGSSTSAALVLQRALVLMHLPDALAGELTKELDQSLAKRAKRKTGFTKAKKKQAETEAVDEDTPAAANEEDEPDVINVIVNNKMEDSSYNVTFSDVVNHSLPYFYAYKYPPAYIAGGQAPFATPTPYAYEGGKESPMNVIVNVNNYIMPKNEDTWGTPCSTARCFQMHAAGNMQLHASNMQHATGKLEPRQAAVTPAVTPAAAECKAQVAVRQRALAKKLASVVDALKDIRLLSNADALTRHAGSAGDARAHTALDEQRQRLVDTARTLEGIARHKAAAIRQQRGRAHTLTPADAHTRALATKAKMTSLFELVLGSGARALVRHEGRSTRATKVDGADVLSHMDDWEEAQRHDMHDESGF